MEEVDILDENNNQGNRKLVDTNKILWLGILSVIFVTAIGILLAVVTINLSGPQIREYNRHTSLYAKKYYKRVKLGRYLAIGGLIARLVFIAIMIIFF